MCITKRLSKGEFIEDIHTNQKFFRTHDAESIRSVVFPRAKVFYFFVSFNCHFNKLFYSHGLSTNYTFRRIGSPTVGF